MKYSFYVDKAEIYPGDGKLRVIVDEDNCSHFVKDCLDNVLLAIDEDNLKPSDLDGELEIDHKSALLKLLFNAQSYEEWAEQRKKEVK